jgi:DNA-binding transcriptional LysR family regulator
MPDPFDLNLRHLRAIGAIIGRGGMSAAADAVGLSQPALTQGLAKLEAQLGTILFERRPEGLRPTPEGEAVARRTDAAFDHLAAAVRGGTRGFGRPERLMTASQLRAFLALADAGSFVAAGQGAGLSQPAIHRSVRDLEHVTGAALVERRGRGVVLTPAGRRLARGVRLARGEIAGAVAEAGPHAETGRIVIGAMPLSRAALVPRAVARLVAERPGLSLSIVEGSWRELVEPLRDGVIDLMIGALRAEAGPDLAQEALQEDVPVVVAGAGHPLVGGTVPPPERLAGFPWIVGHPGSPLRDKWEALFAGTPPPARPIECGSVMVIRELLRRGDFLTLLSPAQVAPEVAAGILAHVPTEHAAAGRTIGITTRAGWRPTRAQAALVAHLHDAARDG